MNYSKKMKIAFTGVYDIDNYGDHLFPIVFEGALKERGLDFELFLFSPIGGKQGFQQNREVYRISDIDKLHKLHGFDAVVIGGGGILHYASGEQKIKRNSKEYLDYPVFETWIIPSMFALKNKVPIIWNLPGGFHDFPDFYQHLTKSLCTQVDYISVRDSYTKNILLDSNIKDENIHVYLDSAFLMRKYISDDYLESLKTNLLKENKYIVFHANRHLKNEDIPHLVEILDSLKKKFKIILLPLAGTHDDKSILYEINEEAKKRDENSNGYHIFKQELSIYEIMAILANSELYIGVSFHGAITALCHGKKTIAFDYMRNGKTKDLFAECEIEDYYADNIKDLKKVVKKRMEDPRGVSKKIEVKTDDLRLHFDKIVKVLQQPYTDKNFSEFSTEFSKAIFFLTNYFDSMEPIKSAYYNLEEVARATHIEYEKGRLELKKMHLENEKLLKRLAEIENTR